MEPPIKILLEFGEAKAVNMVKKIRTPSGKAKYFVSLNRICLKGRSATIYVIVRFDKSSAQLNKSSIYEIYTTTLRPKAAEKGRRHSWLGVRDARGGLFNHMEQFSLF